MTSLCNVFFALTHPNCCRSNSEHEVLARVCLRVAEQPLPVDPEPYAPPMPFNVSQRQRVLPDLAPPLRRRQARRQVGPGQVHGVLERPFLRCHQVGIKLFVSLQGDTQVGLMPIQDIIGSRAGLLLIMVGLIRGQSSWGMGKYSEGSRAGLLPIVV